MARISRKQNKAEQAAACTKRYSAGIYTRLSVEDNGYESKNSIQNQITFLKEYVEKREELNLIRIYVDNGATGTNFDREEWQCLMEDIKAGKINCVIVKDFSRIGRNYIEVGNYLENVFPFLQVRVIAVNENYDSSKQSFESSTLMNALTNIVNEYYAKDISGKVIQVKRAMQQKGEFVSGIVPYGYKKSDEDRKKLVIDGESASVVQKIFQWRLQGKGCTVISNYLNELALPSPGLYRYMNGNKRFNSSQKAKWKSKHVAGILTNPIYLGHMVQGKTQRSYFERGGKIQSVPQDKWMIVENTHKPLVSQEEFDIVSAIAAESRNKHMEQMNAHKDIPCYKNPLRRKFLCGQCGGVLTRRSRVMNGVRDYYYFCTAPEMRIGAFCRNTHVHEEALMEAVTEAADCQLCVFGQLEKDGTSCQRTETYLETEEPEDKKKQEITDFIQLIQEQKKKLYAEFREGLLARENYEDMKAKLAEKVERYKEEMQKLGNINRMEDEIQNVMKQRRQDILDNLIESVVVYSPNRVEITFTYADELDR